MPYDKYITKDGKVYGPYVYHSKRVDGKVVSEYRGQTNGNTEKFLLVLGALVVIILAAFFVSLKGQSTGYSILGIDANYQENTPLQGSLNFQLRDGELVPADAEVLFENAGDQYNFPLSEIVTVQPVEGDFFVSGKSLSGSGMGFGTLGVKETSPEVSFTLLVYSLINETDTEIENEVSGVTSAENSFSYELQEGERAELKPLSVSVGGERADDGIVSVETEGSTVAVSTSYTASEGGYGEEYLGEKTTNFEIDLNKLNLNLQPGQLDVSILHTGESIVSLSTILGEQAEEDSNVPVAEEQEEEVLGVMNETKKEIPVASLELSAEEQIAFNDEFAEATVEVTELGVKNGFVRVRYELGNFWVENSYDDDFTDETLATFIERDKQKFKKDLAKALVRQEEATEVALPN